MANSIRKGTPCLVCSRIYPRYNGMVVVVETHDAKDDSYTCTPQMYDESGAELDWYRQSLRPLNGGRGTDEMLRIAGKPEDARV